MNWSNKLACCSALIASQKNVSMTLLSELGLFWRRFASEISLHRLVLDSRCVLVNPRNNFMKRRPISSAVQLNIPNTPSKLSHDFVCSQLRIHAALSCRYLCHSKYLIKPLNHVIFLWLTRSRALSISNRPSPSIAFYICFRCSDPYWMSISLRVNLAYVTTKEFGIIFFYQLIIKHHAITDKLLLSLSKYTFLHFLQDSSPFTSLTGSQTKTKWCSLL